jgi:hypothetical protein
MRRLKPLPAWIHLAVVGSAFLFVLGAISNGFFGKAGEYLWKQAEAKLPAIPQATQMQASLPATPQGPASQVRQGAMIRMSGNSGLENVTLDINGARNIGVLNEGVDGAHFKGLIVKGAKEVGIENKNSRNLAFEDVTVDMTQPHASRK